jgi:lipopolysaccharide biosynthesis glycosyltransferase
MFQDMDVLNIACRGKIKYLSPAFCLTTYISEYNVYRREGLLKVWNKEEIAEAISNGIVHFNGKKPWKDVCINFDIWWEYYRRCPYFDEKHYFDFFNYKLNELDHLPLMKRVKVLLRYFIIR